MKREPGLLIMSFGEHQLIYYILVALNQISHYAKINSKGIHVQDRTRIFLFEIKHLNVLFQYIAGVNNCVMQATLI